MRTFLLTSRAEACKLKVIASTHSITCLCLLWCVLTFQLLFRRAGATSGYSSMLESGDRKKGMNSIERSACISSFGNQPNPTQLVMCKIMSVSRL